ncbi:MAG: hypothetical protein AAF497_22945, partial [Planctomycetota bacterium]
PTFGLIGGLVFIGSVFVGFCISVFALFLATKYQRVATHAFSGLILNSILALAIVGMFYAVGMARDAAVRAREAEQSASQLENVD